MEEISEEASSEEQSDSSESSQNLTSQDWIKRIRQRKIVLLSPISAGFRNESNPSIHNVQMKRKREVFVTKGKLKQLSPQRERTESCNESKSRSESLQPNPSTIPSKQLAASTLQPQEATASSRAKSHLYKKKLTGKYSVKNRKSKFTLRRRKPMKKSLSKNYNYEEIKKIKARIGIENPSKPNYWEKIEQYKAHRRKLKEIANDPKLKYSQAKIPITCIYNVAHDHKNMEKDLEIDLENIKILRKIRWLYGQEPKFKAFQQLLFNNDMRDNNIYYKFAGLGDLAKQNMKIWMNLNKTRSQLDTRDELTKWYKRQKQIILNMTRYPIYNETRLCAPFEELASFNAKVNPRPIVYIDYDVSSSYVCRIFIELYADICPMTAENFRCLCTGQRGTSYVCTKLEYMFPGYLYSGGSGLSSIYGSPFPDENYKVKHDQPGIISMVNDGVPDSMSNNSEYQIILKPTPEFNRKFCAFGRVIKGLEGLERVSQLTKPDVKTGLPAVPVFLNDCGETDSILMDMLLPPATMKRRELYMADALAAAKPVIKVLLDVDTHSDADSDVLSSGSSYSGLGDLRDKENRLRKKRRRKKKKHQIERDEDEEEEEEESESIYSEDSLERDEMAIDEEQEEMGEQEFEEWLEEEIDTTLQKLEVLKQKNKEDELALKKDYDYE